jgi:uncharacterized protein (TIGR02246 family)
MFRMQWCFCALLIAQCGLAQDAAPSADEEAVRQVVGAYVEAFNNHDAEALAALWEEDAVYVDRNTGERVEGRAALQADFAVLFEGQPDARLSGEVDTVDFVTGDVASVEGRAAVFVAESSPNETAFTATLVRHGDNWLLHSVREVNVPVPPSPQAALQELAWMLGDWIDESDDLRVDTSVTWSPNGAFLLRSFVVQDAEGPLRQGTQVIGWDPRSHEIRSWTFNSDGSFGDGVWTESADHWLVQSTQTLADGSAASGTYVVTPVDEDSMTVQLIGHEIEGEPQPATEAVTIVRATAQPAAGGTAGDEQ